MLMDRGKINEVQIRLLLSSRSEMQKVIEQARQQSLSMQKKILSGQSITPTVSTKAKNETDPRLKSRNDDSKRRSGRDRSNSRYRSSRSSSDERDYRDHRRRDRSRSESRSRSRRDRHRSSRRSRSRDRSRERKSDKPKAAEPSQTSVWDLINKKPEVVNPYSNAYSTKAPTKSNEIDLTSSPQRESENIPGLDGIIDKNAINNLKNLLNSNPNLTSAGLLSALSSLTKPSSPVIPAAASTPMPPAPPIIKPFADPADSSTGHFYPPIIDGPSRSQNDSKDTDKNDRDRDREAPRYTDDEIQDKRCIRISHLNPKTTYSEVRRHFSGLFIQTNGIKLINDDKGDRLGTAYVKFVRPTSTPKAMFRDGSMLNGWKVKVDVVSETEFDVAIDSYRPAHKWHDKPREEENNGSSRHIEDSNAEVTVLKLFDLPAYTSEIDIQKAFGANRKLEIRLDREKNSNKQYGYVKFENSLELKRALLSNSCPRVGNHKIDVRKSTEEEMEKLCKAMDTDVLVLSDLPAFSAEQDIMKLFNNFSIIDIFMTRTKPEGVYFHVFIFCFSL